MNKIKIDGPEAKGYAEIVKREDSTFLILTDLWIAPGAPDVQVSLSSNVDGKLDKSLQHVAFLPYGKKDFEFDISKLDLSIAKTIIVFCTQFFVHFGHGNIN